MTKNLFLNKQIILATGMIVFIVAAVIGGTGAFFSDTESSTGNVFTAGSVSLTLGQTTHAWLGAPNTVLPANYFNLGPTNNIVMGDLKPGDNGLLTTPVTNGANDAFMCARVTAVSPNPLSKITDYLKFRTGTGPGGSVSDILAVVPVGEWFSPAAPALNLPAVPLAAAASGGVALEYCFGDFTPGSVLGDGCTVNPATNYNDAQLSSVSIDLEYYVVQQRNNEGFTCAGLNPLFSAEYVATESNAVRVIGGATEANPLGSTASVASVYGAGSEFSLNINEVGGDMIFVASTPFAVTGSDNSLSVLIDSNGDGFANFQFEYTNNTVIYKEVAGGNWTVGAAPAGYSAVMNGGIDGLTVTVPKAVLSSPFRVGANATNNGAAGFGGTNVGMSIPFGDLFNGGASNWTSSANYQTVNW